MKLLLTSNGLSNSSIAQALFDLVGKSPSETKISFIPTAMNVVDGDKSWFVEDLTNIKKQNIKLLDVVDISALPKKIWQPRIDDADVLFFSGGNTSHVMRWIKESGLQELLPEYLQSKVWAGISAGSIVTNPTLFISNKDEKIYPEENFNYASEEALGLVNFYVRPHYNSQYFPHANKSYLEEVAKDIPERIYALDDMSAVKVDHDSIEIISEGEYLLLNQT